MDCTVTPRDRGRTPSFGGWWVTPARAACGRYVATMTDARIERVGAAFPNHYYAQSELAGLGFVALGSAKNNDKVVLTQFPSLRDSSDAVPRSCSPRTATRV